MTIEERVEALSAVPLFEALDRPALETIAQTANELEAPAGQVLIEARMKGTGMFVLLEGVATVDLRGRPSRELEAGGCFGELALLTPDGVRTARVRAKTDVRCLAIGRSEFREMLLANPEVALALLEVVATRAAAHE